MHSRRRPNDNSSREASVQQLAARQALLDRYAELVEEQLRPVNHLLSAVLAPAWEYLALNQIKFFTEFGNSVGQKYQELLTEKFSATFEQLNARMVDSTRYIKTFANVLRFNHPCGELPIQDKTDLHALLQAGTRFLDTTKNQILYPGPISLKAAKDHTRNNLIAILTETAAGFKLPELAKYLRETVVQDFHASVTLPNGVVVTPSKVRCEPTDLLYKQSLTKIAEFLIQARNKILFDRAVIGGQASQAIKATALVYALLSQDKMVLSFLLGVSQLLRVVAIDNLTRIIYTKWFQDEKRTLLLTKEYVTVKEAELDIQRLSKLNQDAEKYAEHLNHIFYGLAFLSAALAAGSGSGIIWEELFLPSIIFLWGAMMGAAKDSVGKIGQRFSNYRFDQCLLEFEAHLEDMTEGFGVWEKYQRQPDINNLRSKFNVSTKIGHFIFTAKDYWPGNKFDEDQKSIDDEEDGMISSQMISQIIENIFLRHGMAITRYEGGAIIVSTKNSLSENKASAIKKEIRDYLTCLNNITILQEQIDYLVGRDLCQSTQRVYIDRETHLPNVHYKAFSNNLSLEEWEELLPDCRVIENGHEINISGNTPAKTEILDHFKYKKIGKEPAFGWGRPGLGSNPKKELEEFFQFKERSNEQKTDEDACSTTVEPDTDSYVSSSRHTFSSSEVKETQSNARQTSETKQPDGLVIQFSLGEKYDSNDPNCKIKPFADPSPQYSKCYIKFALPHLSIFGDEKTFTQIRKTVEQSRVVGPDAGQGLQMIKKRGLFSYDVSEEVKAPDNDKIFQAHTRFKFGGKERGDLRLYGPAPEEGCRVGGIDFSERYFLYKITGYDPDAHKSEKRQKKKSKSISQERTHSTIRHHQKRN